MDLEFWSPNTFRTPSIVDLYPASPTCGRWLASCIPMRNQTESLDEVHQSACWTGIIEKLVGALRSIDTAHPQWPRKIRIEARLLEEMRSVMRYPVSPASTLLGSGVIEPEARPSERSRLITSGSSWTVPGSQAILALALLSSQWPLEDYVGRAPGGSRLT